MAIYKNCQPIPCNDDTSIREWIEANPPPVGSALPQQLDWLVGYLRAYACACGCGDEQLQQTLQQLLNFFQNLRCPDRPLPVQDCLSPEILEQLRAINQNTDELEITAQNINLNANQINLNTDQVETLLQNILNRLNQDCTNPLSTRVCNTTDITNPIVAILSNILAAVAPLNGNTDQIEGLLQAILNRLNADCSNPLRTQVCNTNEITGPIVEALSNINLNLPPRPVLDCNLNTTGDEAPGVAIAGVVVNRPCPAPNLNTLGLTLNANQAGAIPPNVKSWTVIVFEGSATINGQPNILAGTTLKGGGYSDGSRVGNIPLITNAGSRLVAFWEI